ncbi:WD40 repeat domain-containing protein [Planctomycetaceae bacterium SH139]
MMNTETTQQIETKQVNRITLPTGVMDIAVSVDGTQLFAACHDGLYRVGADGKQAEKIGGHASWVAGVGVVDQGRRLVSAGYDGNLQIHRLEGAGPVQLASQPDSQPAAVERTIAAHDFWSWKMAVSPDQSLVASVTGQYLAGDERYAPRASHEATVKVFAVADGGLRHAFALLPSVQAVSFDPTGRYLAAGNLMGDVGVWDLASGNRVAAWRTPDFTSWGIIKSHCYIGGIHAICFAPDGNSLYVAGMGEMRDPMAGNGRQLWQRFDWRADPPTKLAETIKDQAGEGLMESLVMHPGGEWFVMAGRLRGGDWNAGLFAVDDGQRIGFLKTEARITAASFSADGSYLYLAGMKNQPGPKEGKWPEYGVIDRYQVWRV